MLHYPTLYCSYSTGWSEVCSIAAGVAVPVAAAAAAEPPVVVAVYMCCGLAPSKHY
jgi:hypothetical protein